MRKSILALVTVVLATQFSLAMAADPSIQQVPPRPMAPQRGSTLPQLQLTPAFLYQQITALKQQVQILQAQVNSLRSVVQITPNGTTIAAEHLAVNGDKSLALVSSKNVGLTAGDNISLTGGKNLELKSGKNLTSEASAQLKLKAPQIQLNGANKPIALKDSPVAGGKVISGSSTVFAQ